MVAGDSCKDAEEGRASVEVTPTVWWQDFRQVAVPSSAPHEQHTPNNVSQILLGQTRVSSHSNYHADLTDRTQNVLHLEVVSGGPAKENNNSLIVS